MYPHKKLFHSRMDRMKLCSTLIIGATFFMYQIQHTDKYDIIHSDLGQTIVPTLSHNVAYGITLESLLLGFDEDIPYQEILNDYCQQFGGCGHTHVEFSFNTNKESYYKLLVLKTLAQGESQLVLQSGLHTIITVRLQYDTDNRKRGYTTHNTIVLNLAGLSSRELYEVLSHEIGHIIDLSVLQGTSRTLDSNYTEFQRPTFSIDDPSIEYYKFSRDSEGLRKTDSRLQDFCSIYGMSDPFEDFAECFNLYINHHDYFLLLSKTNTTLQQKYHFIQSRVRQTPSYLHQIYNYNTDISHRYRDSTKIPISGIEIPDI